MMTIELLLFAQLREALSADRMSREVPDGTTVERAAAEVLSESSNPALARLPLVYAVNERYVAADHPLHDGDRLALITPFSGG
ncbi:MAG: MoaD/ThiS family protein [Candidatus Krumholzibacteriia bacterium]